jgi:hypothetical protein
MIATGDFEDEGTETEITPPTNFTAMQIRKPGKAGLSSQCIQ